MLITEYSLILPKYLFYLIAVISNFIGVVVITRSNSIHAILWLILVYFNVTMLMIMLRSDFLAFMYLIVYIGAIAIFFIFAVMMLNIKQDELSYNMVSYIPIVVSLSMLLLLEYYVYKDTLVDLIGIESSTHSLYNNYMSPYYYYLSSNSDLNIFGQLLYTSYGHLFLIASLILLVGMIGAIVLTLEYREFSIKKQDIFKQISRDLNTTVRYIK